MLAISWVSSTPSWAMRSARPASSTASAVVSPTPDTRAAWRSAPCAMSVVARAISAIASRVCCDVADICWDAAETCAAVPEISRIIPLTSARIAL